MAKRDKVLGPRERRRRWVDRIVDAASRVHSTGIMRWYGPDHLRRVVRRVVREAYRAGIAEGQRLAVLDPTAEALPPGHVVMSAETLLEWARALDSARDGARFATHRADMFAQWDEVTFVAEQLSNVADAAGSLTPPREGEEEGGDDAPR